MNNSTLLSFIRHPTAIYSIFFDKSPVFAPENKSEIKLNNSELI